LLGKSSLLSSGDQSRAGLQQPLSAATQASTSVTIAFSFVTNERFMADSTSRFGFVAFAETWNGRLAMLGFVIGLGTELLTGQGILGQLGLG
jgi:hypothetical protein